MSSVFFIAFILAIGGGTWVWNKVQRTTGGNNQTSILMGTVAGVVILIVTLILSSFIPE